jgi:type I restriction enzyme S subunit
VSRVEELITQLCPNGIAFTELRNVCQIKNGKDWKTQEHGDIPVYGSGGRMEATVLSPSYSKPTVLLPRKGSLNVQYVEEPFWNVDTVFYTIWDAEVVEPKFLFYYLKTINLAAISTSSTRPSLTQTALSKIRVPVPPLPVQREIVRILDKFTQLEAELEARKKQYSIYADKLLEPNDGARKLALGEIAMIVRGSSPRPIQSFLTDDGTGTPWIKIGDVPADGKYVTHTNQRINDGGVRKSRLIAPGDFILSNSMSFGRPYISKIAGCIHDGWLSISQFEETLIPDFLYYLLRSDAVQAEFSRRAGSSTVKNLNADIVKSVVVSVPPIEDQHRIVKVLNNFDNLTNNLSFGLPAEIVARRKQYEYYRDKLLTFKALSV